MIFGRGGLLLVPFCTQRNEVQREKAIYWSPRATQGGWDFKSDFWQYQLFFSLWMWLFSIKRSHKCPTPPLCRCPGHSLTNRPAQFGALQKGRPVLNSLTNTNVTKAVVSDLKKCFDSFVDQKIWVLSNSTFHTNKFNIHTAKHLLWGPVKVTWLFSSGISWTNM